MLSLKPPRHTPTLPASGDTGGFGGGAGGGANTGGGGGLGAGGDIFVMAGASLTIESGSLSGGSVTPGAGESGGANGEALGSGIFLQGTETITFAPAKGTTEQIFDVIADQTGSGGTGANAGAGGLTLDGAGTLDLIAASTFTGGTTIDKGVLELANAAAAGRGTIHFASTSGEVAARGSAAGCSSLTTRPEGPPRRWSRSTTLSSPAILRSAALAG